MKKLLLTSLMLCGLSSESESHFSVRAQVNTDALPVVALAGVGTLAIAMYWKHRESNGSVVTRALILWNVLYQDMQQCNDIYDVQKFLMRYQGYEGQVNSLYHTLNSRCSYVKPWNWSSSMREAFDKIDGLHALFKLTGIVDRYAGFYDSHAVVSSMRNRYSGYAYPLIQACASLRADMYALSGLIHLKCIKLVRSMILELLQVIESSPAYADEQYCKKLEEARRRRLAEAQRLRWEAEQRKKEASQQLKKVEQHQKEQAEATIKLAKAAEEIAKEAKKKADAEAAAQVAAMAKKKAAEEAKAKALEESQKNCNKWISQSVFNDSYED